MKLAKTHNTLSACTIPKAQARELSEFLGDPADSQRLTVNIAGEVADELHDVAKRYDVSESSVVEIALRHLLLRVPAPALAAFLRERGACLRRRAP